MSTHTPYLDYIILASVSYPAGLSYSLYATLRGKPSKISTELLVALLLPFVAVASVVAMLRPSLLSQPETTWWLLPAAVLLVPITFSLEYVIHGLEAWYATGQIPHGISVQSFWNCRLSVIDHILLGLIAAGEEIFFRLIWISLMLSLSISVPVALVVSSIAYGLNHLSFGGISVLSKGVSGFFYGALYLFGGQSIILPIVAHVLQNFALLRLTRERRG